MLKADFLPSLESLADSRTIERGRGYFREGRVGDVRRTLNRIDARVRGIGHAIYSVNIALDMRGEEGLAYDCDCPSPSAPSPQSERQWRELVARLRDTHARKPNFVARMNALLA